MFQQSENNYNNVDKNSNKVLLNLSKLELLDRTKYHRWSKKVLNFFQQLEVDYVLITDPPSDPAVTISTPSSDLESSTSPPIVDQLKQVSIVDLEK